MRPRVGLAICAIAAAFAGQAQAGGSLKDDPLPGIVYDWSGLYVGGHVGSARLDLDTEYEKHHHKKFSKGTDYELDGWLAGGHVGLQRQFNHLVLGVEASLSGGSVSDTEGSSFSFDEVRRTSFGPVGLFGSGDQELSARMRNLLLLTGRVGFAWEQWLAYVKGGYASAEISVKGDFEGELGACLGFLGCGSAPYSLSGETSERHHGWTVGGGLEFMVRPNVILGLEYNYIDLGSKTHKGTAEGSFSKFDFDADYAVKVDPDALHVVYARLSLKLGDPVHAAAPMK